MIPHSDRVRSRDCRCGGILECGITSESLRCNQRPVHLQVSFQDVAGAVKNLAVQRLNAHSPMGEARNE